jgi:hypothetical protein
MGAKEPSKDADFSIRSRMKIKPKQGTYGRHFGKKVGETDMHVWNSHNPNPESIMRSLGIKPERD